MNPEYVQDCDAFHVGHNRSSEGVVIVGENCKVFGNNCIAIGNNIHIVGDNILVKQMFDGSIFVTTLPSKTNDPT